jgi:hypothetical protein
MGRVIYPDLSSPSSSNPNRHRHLFFQNIPDIISKNEKYLNSPAASVSFLHGSLFGPEDGGDMLLRNVRQPSHNIDPNDSLPQSVWTCIGILVSYFDILILIQYFYVISTNDRSDNMVLIFQMWRFKLHLIE